MADKRLTPKELMILGLLAVVMVYAAIAGVVIWYK